MTADLTRRDLLAAGGTAAASLPLAAHGQGMPGHAQGQAAQAPPRVWRFFNEAEARLVTAMVDRLIPADAEFTGAAGAGVPEYLDGQLAGAWGHGNRLYRLGPFQQGTPEQGYQLPFTPAELYRLALPAFAAWVRQGYGSGFEALPGALQDEALSRAETGEAGFEQVSSAVFFETLLANTVEGFLSDPMYGGNRDFVGWRMVGFPGPYAGYVDLLERHDLRFTRAPRGIAEAMQEHAAHHRAPTPQR
ncbi:gluconate 2-dehydrogenase subunit 3 family protein [Falsiroseomonas selenitidurans]|uniref:Gluconate 2-dehydrogenase subunit 3 family protein n=1 Tax=Falsiroseomonas selenitidurans TaxID=2716335 RepID=A0ABX1DYL2_9PROT|nr:gluconate 2-dehydrogenase subunit 3 family protein [Falsiroseomonas selenitidurans]NKC29475.1 gluconate 2-dehydrogenase subunit 3 family protein [Falsiroseomonas selenitidurans]